MRENPSFTTRIQRGAKAILYAGLLTAVATGCVPSSKAKEVSTQPTHPSTPVTRVTPEARPTLIPAEIWPDITVDAGSEIHIEKANSFLSPYLGMEEMHVYQSPFPSLPMIAIGAIWQPDVQRRDAFRGLAFQDLAFPSRSRINYQEGPKTDQSLDELPEYQTFQTIAVRKIEKEAQRFKGYRKTIEMMLRPDSGNRKVLVFEKGYVVFNDGTSSSESVMMVNWYFEPATPLRNIQ